MHSRQKPESWQSLILKPDQALDPAQIAGPLTVLRVAYNIGLVALPERISADVIHAENCASYQYRAQDRVPQS